MDTQEKAPGINATAKPDAKRKTSKGAEIMVDYLIKEKVPYLFGVCGHGNIGFLDAAANAADRIKTISLHHEQAAGYMADAYYKVKHQPVATYTSCGPGSCNLPVALAAVCQLRRRGGPRVSLVLAGVDRGVGDPTPSAPLTNPPSGRAGIAVRAAYSQLGVPYRYAGATPGVAFDCSGLTMWAWGLAGVSMSHGAQALFDEFPHVPINQARPGDLLFSYSPIGHVGIYVGGGLMIHAPYTGAWVSLRRIDWNKIVGVSRPG